MPLLERDPELALLRRYAAEAAAGDGVSAVLAKLQVCSRGAAAAAAATLGLVGPSAG